MTTQINQLTELTTTSDGDLLLIRESATGVDKKIQSQNLRAKATTKDDVGLGNVDNVSAADLRDRSTHTGTQTLSTISDAGTMAAEDKSNVTGDVNFDSGTLFVDASADAVGIGTTSPAVKFHSAITTTGEVGRFSTSVNDFVFGTVRSSSVNTFFGGADASVGWGGTLSNHPYVIKTNDQERMRIDSSGHAIIPAGVTLGTSAGVYNAANTLDDYEEGDWTPVLTDGTNTQSFGTNKYVKIGRQITLSCTAFLNPFSTSGWTSNALYFTGIPFAASLASSFVRPYVGAVMFRGNAGGFAYNDLSVFIGADGTIQLADQRNDGSSYQKNLAANTFWPSGAFYFGFTLTYFV